MCATCFGHRIATEETSWPFDTWSWGSGATFDLICSFSSLESELSLLFVVSEGVPEHRMPVLAAKVLDEATEEEDAEGPT